MRALDVGCGVGVTDAHLAGRFAELQGVDTSEEAIRRAAAANPGVLYRAYDGDRLPYEDETFDLAFAICVMHHVDPEHGLRSQRSCGASSARAGSSSSSSTTHGTR